MKLSDQQAHELHNQLHIYWQQLQELLDILELEKQSIAKRQFEEFSRVLEHKHNLLQEIVQFDEALSSIIKKILKKPTKEALQNAINTYEGPLAKTIRLQYKNIQDIAIKCRKANEVNNKVIAHTQQHYSRLSALLRREDPDAKTYAKNGRQASGKTSGGHLAQA